MQAIISIENNRVCVKSEFDAELIKFYKTIEKYYWDASNKRWTFPIDAKETIMQKLTELNIQFSMDENMPYLKVVADGEKVEIESDLDDRLIDLLRSIPGYKWHKTRCIISKSRFEDFAQKYSQLYKIKINKVHDRLVYKPARSYKKLKNYDPNDGYDFPDKAIHC